MASRHFSSNFSRSFARDTSWCLFGLATWFPVVYLFNTNIGTTASIHGASMYPYLNTDYDRSLKKDICYMNKWLAKDNIQRGMIVSFWSVNQYFCRKAGAVASIYADRDSCRSPYHPEVQAIKRVIAVEGDVVFTKAPYPNPTFKVPRGHVWVEGDGTHGGKNSLDSNTYGPISKNLITGKVTHILWPWKSFGAIRWWEFRPKTRVILGEEEP